MNLPLDCDVFNCIKLENGFQGHTYWVTSEDMKPQDKLVLEFKCWSYAPMPAFRGQMQTACGHAGILACLC